MNLSKRISNRLITLLLLIAITMGSAMGAKAADGLIANVTELDAAIQAASNGAVIELSPNFVSSDYTLSVPTDITIKGNNAVWKEKLYIKGTGSIVLSDLILVGKPSDTGTGIQIEQSSGSVKLNNIEFKDIYNNALLVNSGASAHVTINDSVFKNISGRSIYLGVFANVTINSSTFKDNLGVMGQGYEGGTISGKENKGNLLINNSVFENNVNRTRKSVVYGGGGGAIALNQFDGKLIIKNSYFKGNKTNMDKDDTGSATYDGGAIHIMNMHKQAAFEVYNSTFAENVALDDGGAILIQTEGLNETITGILFENNTFYKNVAYGVDNSSASGGAIQIFTNVGYGSGGNTHFVKPVFRNNTFVQNSVGGHTDFTISNAGGGAVAASKGFMSPGKVIPKLENNLFAGNFVVRSNVNNEDYTSSNVTGFTTPEMIETNAGYTPSSNNLMDILGTRTPILSKNQSSVKAGKEKVVVPTVAIRPEGKADLDSTPVMSGKDQRGFNRNNNAGSVEISWIKFDTNQGTFSPGALGNYTGDKFYTLDENNNADSYYLVGVQGKQTKLASEANVVPSKDGFTFLGWDLDPNAVTPQYNANDSLNFEHTGVTLYAIWEAAISTATVTYDDGLGGIAFAPQTHTVNIGDATPAFNEDLINYEGFMLIGWNQTIEPTVTGDVVYVAMWKKIENIANDLTVDFNSNGGSVVDSIIDIAKGSNIAKPQDPTKAGYTFAGWYKDDAAFLNDWNFATDTVEESLTLYAKWEEVPVVNMLVVDFNSNGGSKVASIVNITKGETIKKPQNPTKKGYVFKGWFVDDQTFKNEWDFVGDSVETNLTLHAKWVKESQGELPNTGISSYHMLYMGALLATLGLALILVKKEEKE